jgi:hypothetical protein
VILGILLRAISVIGQLAPDGVIEPVSFELDTTSSDENADADDQDGGED